MANHILISFYLVIIITDYIFIPYQVIVSAIHYIAFICN